MNEQLLTIIVAAPGITFLILSLCWLLGWTPPERFVARLTKVASLIMVAASAWLGLEMMRSGVPEIRAMFGDWFHAGEYEFVVDLFVDRLSLPLVALTSLLVGIVGVFSVRYLHRERGYFRFFALLHLFSFGALLAFTAGSFDLLIGGWELVGVTSVLLIAFFYERRDPVRNAVRVFVTYRIADVGLLLAVFVMHYLGGSANHSLLFTGVWPNQVTTLDGPTATVIALLLLWGAAGKSALVPFSGWLPRAMEGPTPSSAIFYGAISVHLGAYLLLRAEPLLKSSWIASAAVILVGASTALLGTLSHRVVSDAKTGLAYATMTQLGVIFVEIGLGFPRLALTHLIGHAVVRTLQFLRAPSMLHDHHKVFAAAGGHLGKTGEHYDGVLSPGLRLVLYRIGLERGFYDAFADRFVIAPVLRLSRMFAALEPKSEVVAMPQAASAASRPWAQEAES
jgi:NAD(P)H-quinone oxidoreductase subunit 5